MKHKAFLIAFTLAFLLGMHLAFAVPTLISYQGKLNNGTTGDPITSGSIRVNVTEISDLDSVIWNFTFENIFDQYGVFDLVLGRNKTLNLSPGRDYQMVIMVDLDEAEFSASDIVFGDLVPAGDDIRINGGGASDATELTLSDNVTTVESSLSSKLGIGVQNNTNVAFVDVNITSGLSVGGNINVTGTINCQNIDGGTDSDFCSDDSGIGAFDDSGITGNTTTLIANASNFNNLIAFINSSSFSITRSQVSDYLAVQNNTDLILNSLNSSKVNVSKELFVTGNLSLGQNLTLSQYATCTLKTDGSGNLECGTDISSSQAIQNDTDTQLTNLNISGNLNVSGNATFADRIGIGTVLPTHELDVTGTINTTQLRVEENASIARLNVTNDLIIGGGINLTSGKINCESIDGGTDTDFCVDGGGTGTVQNNTDALLNNLNITGDINHYINGKVSIGTDTPNGKLHISGPMTSLTNQVGIQANYSTDGVEGEFVGLNISIKGGGGDDELIAIHAGTDENGNLNYGGWFYSELGVDNAPYAYESNNIPNFRVGTGGGVCIGNSAGTTCSSSANAGDLEIEDGIVCIGDGGCSVAGDDGSLLVEGNVGVGTINPNSSLQVKGNVSLNNTLHVTESGRIGLRTATPTHELDITGTTNTTQLRVHENASVDRLNITSGIQAHDTLIMPKQTTYWEYQETANSSYNFDSVSGGTWADTSNFGDGVWDSTYAYKSDNDFWPGRVEVHYNYSKPARAIGARVMLKADDTDVPTTLNKTVSSSCFSAYSDVIALHVMIFRASDAYDYVRLYCWDGASWTTLGTWDEGGADATLDIEIYEEAVHWQMESIPQIGIGVIEPQYNLEVNGSVALKDTLYIPDAGNVGIGTRTPKAPLHVEDNTSDISVQDWMLIAATDVEDDALGIAAMSGNKTIYLYADADDVFKLDAYDYDASAAIDIGIASNGGTTTIGGAMQVGQVSGESVTIGDSNCDSNGCNLEIEDGGLCVGAGGCTASTTEGRALIEGSITTGTTSTVAYNKFGSGAPEHTAAGEITDSDDVYISDDLEVDGSAWLGAGSSSTTGVYWNGADIAEVLHTTYSKKDTTCNGNISCLEEQEGLGYGDLACIDPENVVMIQKCNSSYSTLAIGFVSETTVLHMGVHGGYPIAVAGLVQAKTTNASGNIEPGDLIVSSHIPGTAMKDNNPPPGTLVGKAYATCSEEQCKIPVFVAIG